MSGYGQYCPLALASEVVAERWTLLVLRELMLGARHFNDVRRGVPRMSPSLLTRRLRTLEGAGIVERRRRERRIEYRLTESGQALLPVIESLAVWGKAWLPATLSEVRADPDLVLWDMHRRMNTELLPEGRTVIRFVLVDQPEARRRRWLVCDRRGVDVCVHDPGHDVDLDVESDSRTLVWVWYGDLPLERALDDGRIELHGPHRLRAAFPSWLQLNQLAAVARRRPVEPNG
jgi:DNA-binding HxlR family transcriptional regulator